MVHGPTSARIHDVGGVLQMSNLDNFLTAIQANQPQKYMAFGDSAYSANYLNCEYYHFVISSSILLPLSAVVSMKAIRSYYKPILPGQELTDAQKLCNKRLKTSRQVIEHSFGMVENVFRLYKRPEQFKLDEKDSIVPELSRLGYLLANIYVCYNGNHASSYMKFDCPPPSVDKYLSLDF